MKGKKYKTRYDGSLGEVRVDAFLAKWLTEISRSRIAGLIREGYLNVDGEKVRPAFKLIGGETVTFFSPEETPTELKPVEGELDVVYEDEGLLVVNKPAGLTVHPGAGTENEATLVQLLLARYPAISSVGDPERPGIVHRIDKDTSGLIMVAKSEAVRLKMLDMFSERAFEKEYRALVYGLPQSSSFYLEDYLARSTADRKKMAVVRDPEKGRLAITNGQVVRAFSTIASEVSLIIETGRTHQIRVQMAHYGHPVLGDETYGRSGARLSKLCGAARQMLHAYRLSFSHPVTGSELDLTAPLPADYLKVREALKELSVSKRSGRSK